MYDNPTKKASKYVIYARKSTDNSEKQVHSIEDQLDECRKLSKIENLFVQEEITESCSALTPYKRPKYRELIKKIKNKEIDGIIAWHPDRLSRNMSEGAEIFELLDSGRLKDLKFRTHPFTDDPSGRMLLGIGFTMSTHYSQKLQKDVHRGNSKTFGKGKSLGHYKYGYKRDDKTGEYVPDPDTFEIVKKAFRLRLEDPNKYTYEYLAEWMNSQGFRRVLKTANPKMNPSQKMYKQKVASMFADTFYMGLYKMNVKESDVNEINLLEKSGINFIPVIKPYEYLQLQRFNNPTDKVKDVKHKYPFKGRIKCNFCGSNMQAYAGTSRSGDKSLRYECRNKSCKSLDIECLQKVGAKTRSIRARAIIDEVFKMLERLKITEKEFKYYLEKFQGNLNDYEKQRDSEEKRLLGVRSQLKRELDELIRGYFKIQSKGMSDEEQAVYTKDRDELNKQIDMIDEEMKKIKETERDYMAEIETILNLFKMAGTKWMRATAEQKDQLAQILDLNLFCEGNNVLKITVGEPFASFLNCDVQLGGYTWTRTRDPVIISDVL